MAEGQELFGREVAIDELRAEEHRCQRRDVEGPENPRLFCAVEAEFLQIIEDLDEPCSPDEDLEEHHNAQLDADHRAVLRERVVGAGLEDCKRPAAACNSFVPKPPTAR